MLSSLLGLHNYYGIFIGGSVRKDYVRVSSEQETAVKLIR
ncbi:hypothetical protein PAXY110619_18425 [Paenibacillus xylanexedens]|uniref:Uncharacterized protein n=1 Tax=Paenibacillus xylanexedens TaxID=528191 RepID=A0ABS4RWC3_PAEXY|nr:hypothetical protein [Paenibacillus xylanexedens]